MFSLSFHSLRNHRSNNVYELKVYFVTFVIHLLQSEINVFLTHVIVRSCLELELTVYRDVLYNQMSSILVQY